MHTVHTKNIFSMHVKFSSECAICQNAVKNKNKKELSACNTVSYNAMLFTLPSISKLMNEPEVTSDMIFSQTTAYYNTILTIYAVYRMHTVHSKHIFCIHKVPRCAVFVKMCNQKELNEGNTMFSQPNALDLAFHFQYDE